MTYRLTMMVMLLAASAGAGCSTTTAPESEILELVVAPRWLERPTPQYPDRAFQQSVYQGRVLMRCKVMGDGRLDACSILSEDPPGLGFAEEGLKSAASARVAPESVTEVGAGGYVTFPITWRVEP